jgi:tRNA G18 (ribose-2'-O)-methylase SpoU
MNTDTRNVTNFFKYWTDEAIKTNLDSKRHNFSVLVQNVIKDFNLSTVIRSSNAFLAKEVIIYGSKQYDRRGAVGTHNYENIRHVKNTNELVFPDDYFIIGVDNIENAKPIENYNYPTNKHVLFVFGEENIGLTDELKAICHDFIYIKQYGSVRSLNVGSAASIVMFDYCRSSL